MTARDVAPFWLLEVQLGETGRAWDLFQRVNNRFPEAPEVRAAYAVLLWRKVNPKAREEEDRKIAHGKFSCQFPTEHGSSTVIVSI